IGEGVGGDTPLGGTYRYLVGVCRPAENISCVKWESGSVPNLTRARTYPIPLPRMYRGYPLPLPRASTPYPCVCVYAHVRIPTYTDIAQAIYAPTCPYSPAAWAGGVHMSGRYNALQYIGGGPTTWVAS